METDNVTVPMALEAGGDPTTCSPMLSTLRPGAVWLSLLCSRTSPPHELGYVGTRVAAHVLKQVAHGRAIDLGAVHV